MTPVNTAKAGLTQKHGAHKVMKKWMLIIGAAVEMETGV